MLQCCAVPAAHSSVLCADMLVAVPGTWAAHVMAGVRRCVSQKVVVVGADTSIFMLLISLYRPLLCVGCVEQPSECNLQSELLVCCSANLHVIAGVWWRRQDGRSGVLAHVCPCMVVTLHQLHCAALCISLVLGLAAGTLCIGLGFTFQAVSVC